jgi:hypothetical protein
MTAGDDLAFDLGEFSPGSQLNLQSLNQLRDGNSMVGMAMAMERYYQNDRSRCGRKRLVLRQTGALEFHVCELVAGPDGCERCPTGALATCDLWDKYPKYRTA